MPLDDCFVVRYKYGPKNHNSKDKALVIDFNDMDTGMPVYRMPTA